MAAPPAWTNGRGTSVTAPPWRLPLAAAAGADGEGRKPCGCSTVAAVAKTPNLSCQALCQEYFDRKMQIRRFL